MRKILLVIVLSVTAISANAESRLPFKKELAGDRELPRPWGISIDYYTMEQDYKLDQLTFAIPGLPVQVDPSTLGVENDVDHWDLKLDAWLLPFLNVFVIAGKIDADTTVDISRSGLPLPISSIPVAYDGEVFGGGFTLAAGGDVFFGTVTTTYADTNLSGGFNSSVQSISIQPRFGVQRGDWQYFIGGMWLDTEEKHSGTIPLPLLGPGLPPIPVQFGVELSEQDQFNYTAGIHWNISDHYELTVELGFGDRDHTLVNLGYRF